MVKDLRIDDFDYELPEERIARYPLADRDNCKLLVRQADGTLSQHVFTELPSLLSSDSILVYNNTRVINARLRFRKASGAIIEVFCLEPAEPRDYAVSLMLMDMLRGKLKTLERGETLNATYDRDKNTDLHRRKIIKRWQLICCGILMG